MEMVCEAKKKADQSRETTWEDLPTEIKETIFGRLSPSFLAELRLLNREAFQSISTKVFTRSKDSRNPETCLYVAQPACFSEGELFDRQSCDVQQIDMTFRDSILLQVSCGLMLFLDEDEDNCPSLRVHNPLTKTSRSLSKLGLNDMAADKTYTKFWTDIEIIGNIEDGTYEVALIYSSITRCWTLCSCPLKFARETSFLFFNYKLYCVSKVSTLCYDLRTENAETIQRFFAAGSTTARPFQDSWQFCILHCWRRIYYSRKCMYLAVSFEDYIGVFKFEEEDRSWQKMKLTRRGQTPNETKIQWDEDVGMLWYLEEFEGVSSVTSKRQARVLTLPCTRSPYSPSHWHWHIRALSKL